MPTTSILKSMLILTPALVGVVCACDPVLGAEHATKSGAIGRRAAAAIQQREAEEEIRQHMPILAMQRRSETATANNRHNLSVIDNFVGKALEILALALGVAMIVSAAVEKKEKKQEIISIAAGALLILAGLFCPRIVHTICDWAAKTIFQ
jgi:hypothetical protein